MVHVVTEKPVIILFLARVAHLVHGVVPRVGIVLRMRAVKVRLEVVGRKARLLVLMDSVGWVLLVQEARLVDVVPSIIIVGIRMDIV